jgi:hypothetical protein
MVEHLIVVGLGLATGALAKSPTEDPEETPATLRPEAVLRDRLPGDTL